MTETSPVEIQSELVYNEQCSWTDGYFGDLHGFYDDNGEFLGLFDDYGDLHGYYDDDGMWCGTGLYDDYWDETDDWDVDWFGAYENEENGVE